MILSKDVLVTDQILSADICIVGGGPAAISMALRLMATKYKVIIITGGGWTQTKANENLYKGIVKPMGSHEAPEKNRRRQFGGGSAVWAGRCVPFDAIDFKARSWVPDSGWPVSYPELLPYFKQASTICRIGKFDFDAHSVFPAKQQEIIPGLDSEDFISSRLERYSPPIHFAKTYKGDLEKCANIKILLDTHVVSLNMLKDATSITNVKIVAGEVQATVTANAFVLASGGIENARLLLSSANPHFPAGLGNQYDNVGRYYMTHITGTYAQLNPANRHKIKFDFEKDRDGIFCRRRWWIPEMAQQNRNLLNTIFYLSYSKSLTQDRSTGFSTFYNAVKSLVLGLGIRETLRQQVQKLNQPPPLLAGIYRLGFPFLLPSRNSRYWGLFFQAEQAPNRESRITLSQTQKDAFGMPRVEIQVAFKDIDTESLVAAHNLFAKKYLDSGAGEIIYSEEGFRKYLQYKLTHFNSYAHHMGTTRMSDTPQTGVVDRNGKVYGLKNLFIAGSSTFPTGSHANPTLTVVAQALRLADHLKVLLRANRKEYQPA